MRKALFIIGSILFAISCRTKPINYTTFELEADTSLSMFPDSTFYDGIKEIINRDSVSYIADKTPRAYQLTQSMQVKNELFNIGQGPKEFTSITDISYAKDSLYLFSRTEGKVIVYDRHLNYSREFLIDKLAGGMEMVVNDFGFLYYSTPLAKQVITKLDLKGNYIGGFGYQTADREGFNAYRNERLLLTHNNRIIAVALSEPIVRIYNSSGELLRENRISHPLIANRIQYIEDVQKTPPAHGGYQLALLFRDAVVFKDQLYLLAVTEIEGEPEPNFSFILKYELSNDGELNYEKDFKLYRGGRDDRLNGTDLGMIGNKKLILYDLRSKNIFLFEDDEF